MGDRCPFISTGDNLQDCILDECVFWDDEYALCKILGVCDYINEKADNQYKEEMKKKKMKK